MNKSEHYIQYLIIDGVFKTQKHPVWVSGWLTATVFTTAWIWREPLVRWCERPFSHIQYDYKRRKERGRERENCNFKNIFAPQITKTMDIKHRLWGGFYINFKSGVFYLNSGDLGQVISLSRNIRNVWKTIALSTTYKMCNYPIETCGLVEANAWQNVTYILGVLLSFDYIHCISIIH